MLRSKKRNLRGVQQRIVSKGNTVTKDTGAKVIAYVALIVSIIGLIATLTQAGVQWMTKDRVLEARILSEQIRSCGELQRKRYELTREIELVIKNQDKEPAKQLENSRELEPERVEESPLSSLDNSLQDVTDFLADNWLYFGKVGNDWAINSYSIRPEITRNSILIALMVKNEEPEIKFLEYLDQMNLGCRSIVSKYMVND